MAVVTPITVTHSPTNADESVVDGEAGEVKAEADRHCDSRESPQQQRIQHSPTTRLRVAEGLDASADPQSANVVECDTTSTRDDVPIVDGSNGYSAGKSEQYLVTVRSTGLKVEKHYT